MKKSFVLYLDQYEVVKKLNKEQKAILFDNLFLYNLGEDIKIDDPLVDIVFTVFKTTFDRDKEKWLRKADANRENGKKGGRPKKNKNNALDETHNNPENPDGYLKTHDNPTKPKKAVSGSVSVNVSDSVTLVEVIDKTQIEFDCFWMTYGKKKDKNKCLKKWKLLKEDEKEKIFNCVYDYVLSTPDPQYRKNPLTWLNGKCWEDEIIEPKKTVTKPLYATFED